MKDTVLYTFDPGWNLRLGCAGDFDWEYHVTWQMTYLLEQHGGPTHPCERGQHEEPADPGFDSGLRIMDDNIVVCDGATPAELTALDIKKYIAMAQKYAECQATTGTRFQDYTPERAWKELIGEDSSLANFFDLFDKPTSAAYAVVEVLLHRGIPITPSEHVILSLLLAAHYLTLKAKEYARAMKTA